MEPKYKPVSVRTPDYQYRQAMLSALPREMSPVGKGEYVRNEYQANGRYSNFGAYICDFFLDNGFPVVTERRIGFWRKFVNEMWAFMNGARTLEQMSRYGNEKTWPNFWEKWLYPDKCAKFGLAPGDSGPGSYAVLGNYPNPDGVHFNQFLAMIEQIRDSPSVTTHMVTSWMPYYALGTKEKPRKVVVAPCHGNLIRVLVNQGRLTLQHVQRSADMPVGAVGNMVGYAAVTLALARLFNVEPYRYVHIFLDPHIYDNQLPWVWQIVEREPRPFPTMRIREGATEDFFALRASDFELTDYDPHPAMDDIPVTE